MGIDLGVSAMATLSTGEQWSGPKALRSLLDRLRRLARLHARIANIRCVRCDGLHKLTTSVTRRFHTIGIEDLNVRAETGPREAGTQRQ
jgi:putative transposase